VALYRKANHALLHKVKGEIAQGEIALVLWMPHLWTQAPIAAPIDLFAWGTSVDPADHDQSQ
jgi:hypothetical protein